MLEVHCRWGNTTQVWSVIQVFWGTLQADCSPICDWSLVLTTHGVVPQCRCRDARWHVAQTDDEIVRSPAFTQKFQMNDNFSCLWISVLTKSNSILFIFLSFCLSSVFLLAAFGCWSLELPWLLQRYFHNPFANNSKVVNAPPSN